VYAKLELFGDFKTETCLTVLRACHGDQNPQIPVPA
jgi:hypothetical protein